MHRDPDEALSMLAAGDLPPDEAAALRARIASEPEVAARWAAMQRLLTDLDALPVDHPELVGPPVRLPPEPMPAANRPWGWVAAAVAVAAAVLLWVRTPSEADLVLGGGTSLVEGQLSLLAADVPIRVDGRAAIRVEPRAAVVRGGEGTPSEDSMDRNAILAGLAGAAITVVVYEGSAFVQAEAGQPALEVVPGAPRTFHAPEARPVAGLPAPGPQRDAAVEARVEALQAELASLEQELATERFAGAVARGQLRAEQGEVSEWPAGVSEALTEARVREALVPELEALEGFSVADIDCYEFPCVVALAYDGDDPTLEWGRPVGDVVEAWSGEALENADISMNQSIFRDDDGTDARFVILAVDDGSGGAGVEERTAWRMGQLGERLGDDAIAGD